MHSEALLWVAAIPFAATLGILTYCGIVWVVKESMTQETYRPPVFIANTHRLGCLVFSAIGLSTLLAGLIFYWLGTTSARPTLTGPISQVRAQHVKNGWETKFFLQADDGIRHRVTTWNYIHDLQDGDRVQATFWAYNDELQALTILTGKRTGFHEEDNNSPTVNLYLLTASAAIFGVMAFLTGTGRIRDRRT